MHTTWRTLLGALLLAIPGPQLTACADDPASIPPAEVATARALDLPALAALAVGDDPVAADARKRLRAAGPAGLTAFLNEHTPPAAPAAAPAPLPLARMLGLSSGTGADVPVAAALDEICGQKDCAAARLYWYTDLEQAKYAARASGKPILSLRLLGDLTDELSCANSRFFRALLYPDPAVSALLREQFVLHWQSERPAPKITIDFGDGRSIVTTITGNSVHYVLDATGRPVDALPGLIQPQVFADGLRRAATLARATAGLTGEPLAATMRRYHDERISALARAWDSELAAVGQRPPSQPSQPTLVPGKAPRAGQAAPIAVSKMAVEAPMLGRVNEPVAPISDAELWDRIAARHEHDITFSAPSLALLERHQWRSGDREQDAADHAQAIAALRRAVTLDTLRNEFELHRQIHLRLLAGAGAVDLQGLNQWIYSTLFLTPRSDPWLGLAAPTIYTGLPGGGRRVESHI